LTTIAKVLPAAIAAFLAAAMAWSPVSAAPQPAAPAPATTAPATAAPGTAMPTIPAPGTSAPDTGDAASLVPPNPYPTTQFAPGAKTASVSDGDLTATITMTRRPDIDPDVDVPILTITVAGKPVLEATGIGSDTDEPAAVASIAEMDPTNHHKEVYFSSFSGGCCSSVIVAEEVGSQWVTIPIGDFNGDGGYLQDLNGDGLAEIVAVDGNFINRFDCTACSAAPRVIYTVKAGNVIDLTTDPKFLDAHRAWLKVLEANIDPDQQWKSPGFLAGWLAEKIRVGEGADGWQALNTHWDAAHDAGEPSCPNGDDPDQCDAKDVKTLKFPERLRLFLQAAGYKFQGASDQRNP
jgi:hypothetical protein